MEFKKMMTTLGISTYPEKFEEIFKNLKDQKTNFCDAQEIEYYNNKYAIINEYKELLAESAKVVKEDEALFLYGRLICDYIKVSTTFEARHVPLPEINGCLGRDFFGTLLIFSLIPQSEKFYLDHGFDVEDIKNAYSGLEDCMKKTVPSYGRPFLSMTYYNWTLIYVFGEMFNYDCFNYQFREFYGGAKILKNKETGEFVPVMIENKFHKNGQVLGSAGATDEVGSFEAEFEETDEAFIGHPVIRGRVRSEREVYKKSKWECVLSPGDEVLAVHIPSGTNIAKEEFIRSFKGSFIYAKEKFPERNPKFLVCFSWLMDITLAELFPDSKIAGFGNAFLRYPLKSSGAEFKSWVFPGCGPDNKLLPEDTSMQKILKTLTLAGGYIYYTAGVCTEVLKHDNL